MTPEQIDNNIVKMVSLLPSGSKPIYVPVRMEEYATLTYCFPSVYEKINRDGGSIVFGWQIWNLHFIIEAEFHAIWKSPDGEFIDITPKQIPVDKILFVPDSKTKYSGKQINNIRLNITNSSLVDDFISIEDAIFRITNKGDYANKTGKVTYYGKDAALLDVLGQIKEGLLRMIATGKTRSSTCFCGRDLKYKKCHEPDIKKVVKRIL